MFEPGSAISSCGCCKFIMFMKTHHILVGTTFTGLLICGLIGCGREDTTTTVKTTPLTNAAGIETPAVAIVTNTAGVGVLTNADGSTGVIVK